MELSETDVLNSMVDRIIKKVYFADLEEATLAIELHDGLKIKVSAIAGADISGNVSDTWLELGLTNEQ